MKRLIKTLLCLEIMALISCHQAKDTTRVQVIGFTPPKIIDTLPGVAKAKVNSAITVSYPKVIAAMPFGDSCVLKNYRYNPWDTTTRRDADTRSDGLQFLVDTSQTITIKNDNREQNPYMGDTAQNFYRGYPCFIYNECSQIKWLLTQDDRVMVIQEAMDSNFKWRPIQIWVWEWCGNAFNYTPIKPNHYLFFKTSIYAGNFCTDIRLKLYSGNVEYYSNTYWGWINYGQFTLKYPFIDKKGKIRANYVFLSL